MWYWGWTVVKVFISSNSEKTFASLVGGSRNTPLELCWKELPSKPLTESGGHGS